MFVENSIQDKLDVVIKLNTQLNELNSQLSNLNVQKQKIVNDISDIKLSISDLLKKIEYIDKFFVVCSIIIFFYTITHYLTFCA